MRIEQLDRDNLPVCFDVDRRGFLKVSGGLLSAAVIGATVFRPIPAEAATLGELSPDPTENDLDVAFIHSVCQMCHSRCGIKAKVKNGLLLKIDGNPWHPNNRGEDERLTYATTLSAARLERGRMCPKGQAGIQTLYDPYRIQHPLKRTGPRGSGQWQTITWDQAFSEIAAQINTLIPFADRTTQDVENPHGLAQTLGKIANQLLYSPGRSLEGSFHDRIFKSGYGTKNSRLDHTSICETSHHVANENCILYDHLTPKGGPNHLKPDFDAAEYIIVFGANPVEANFPMVALARKFADMRARGGKIVVVDPRLSNSAAKADLWVPIKPGGDAALGMGIARAILDAARHNVAYLMNANLAAATAAGEPNCTDATWLVIVQAGHANVGKFLTASEAGIVAPLDAANPVCIAEGSSVVTEAAIKGAVPPAVVGQLDPKDLGQNYITVNGIQCRTAFGLYDDRIHEKPLSEYATLAGVSVDTINTLATDLTSYGRKSSVWTYRGVVQHTNGTYAHLAVKILNLLIGNVDYKGGLSKGGGSWDEKNAAGGIDTTAVPGAVSASGVRMDRAMATYTGPIPALRPWFPVATHGNYQEIVPSIQDQYPYPAKVLITYWNAWPYSVPGGKTTWENTVSSESLLPLFVAISPVMGEVPAWADYILPDTTYLEKWSFPGTTPTITTKFASFQQPVVGKYDGSAIGGSGAWTFDPNATNEYTPYLPDTKQLADILIGLAKAIDSAFPGVGANAFSDGSSCDRAWDFFKKQVQNLSINSGKSAADIIARGGAFEDPDNAYDSANPNLLKSRFGGVLHFYSPLLATTTDSITGEKYDGLPRYEPVKHSDGTPVDDAAFVFQLITYKSVLHGQARTAVNPWLMSMKPENYVDMNATDAQALGIETGDNVRLTSASNATGVTGRARLTQGLRPGVVAVMHHYGHWELNSRSATVDGAATAQDASRGAGLTANPIMRRDARSPNVALQDPIGGSVSFNDTRVAVTKVV